MNRNVIAAAFFIFMLGSRVVAQDIYVLQTKGTVTNAAGKKLMPNDLLQPNDKLRFSSLTDAVAVVSSKNGRFIIKPGAAKNESEFVAIVKDALVPGMKKLSSRSGAINNVVDLRTRLQGRVLLLSTMHLPLSKSAFPMSAESFFFIKYRYNGEDINKKLSFVQDTLVIVRDELYAVDGKAIDPAATSALGLYYLRGKDVQHISNIEFITPDLQSLRQEVSLLQKSLNGQKFNRDQEVLLYLTEFYGNLRKEDLDRWTKE